MNTCFLIFKKLTILLFVAMGDQNISGLLHPQIEKFHRLFAELVNLEDLMFQSSSVDVVFKYIDSVWLGNSCKSSRESRKHHVTFSEHLQPWDNESLCPGADARKQAVWADCSQHTLF